MLLDSAILRYIKSRKIYTIVIFGYNARKPRVLVAVSDGFFSKIIQGNCPLLGHIYAKN